MYGAGRFDPGRAAGGGGVVRNPLFLHAPLEVAEGVRATLTVSRADAAGKRNCGPSAKSFVQALDDACETLARVMRVRQSSAVALPPGAAHVVEQNVGAQSKRMVRGRVGRHQSHQGVARGRARVQRDASNEDAWIDLGSSFDESDSPDVRSALESLGRAAGAEAPSMVLDQFEAMTMERDGSPGEEDLSMDGVVDAMLLGGDSIEPCEGGLGAKKQALAQRAGGFVRARVQTAGARSGRVPVRARASQRRDVWARRPSVCF